MESTKERRIGSKFNRYYDKLNMFRNTVLLFFDQDCMVHYPRFCPSMSPEIHGHLSDLPSKGGDRWWGPPPSGPSNSKLQDIQAYITGETSQQHRSDKTNLRLSDLFTTHN